MTQTDPRARDRLSEALDKSLHPATPPPSISLERLRAAVFRIEEKWPGFAAPATGDREALASRMAAHVAENDWAGCPLSRVCEAARAAFDEDRRTRPDLEALRDFYCAETALTDSAVLLSAMVATYIESFAAGAEHSLKLGRALNRAQSRLGERDARLVEAVPAIFDADQAPDAVATAMLGQSDPYAHLRAIGLRAPHAPGLMDEAHEAYVTEMAPTLAEPDAADRLLNWLRREGGQARRSGAASAVTALLAPWTGKDPEPDRLSYLTRTLVDMYGDPRRQTGAPWGQVGTRERDIFLRWLTGENLRLLFDAITDTNDSHMWEERRKFYLGLHEQRRIDAAWVAFAEAGAAEARRILRRGGHGDALSFGRQVARGARSNTSLMILKIGRKIVVDGSHNYKVHVFSDDHPRAPQLFEDRYDCEAIRNSRPPPAAKAHLGDWRNWLEMRI